MENGIAVSAFLSRGIRRAPLFLLSFGIALLFLIPASASAKTWTVTTLQDSTGTTCGSTCSLRQAINAADNDTGDTIQFATGLTGTIELTSSLPLISVSLTIKGPGANLLTISGQGQYQIFDVTYSGTDTMTISGLTLADGNNPGGGAAINDQHSALNVDNCAFVGNTGANLGGAIYANKLTVTNSTFVDNSATDGGAIIAPGTLTVVNSTFDDNSAVNGGAIYGGGTLTVTNSTFVDNKATGTNATGGAIYGGGTATVENDIFADNTTSGADSGAVELTESFRIIEDHNLFYGNTGGDAYGFTPLPAKNSTDITNTDPELTALGYFGGPTETMMPEVGSKAIGNGTYPYTPPPDGNAPQFPKTDQRGFPMNTSAVDIGAVQTNYLVVTTAEDASDGSSSACDANGDSPCTLRDAIEAVDDAKEPPDIDIGFLGNPGTVVPFAITLSQSLSLTQGNTVIIGPLDEVTISGNSSVQILDVSGASASVTLYGLTLENGSSSGNGGAIDSDSSGGGLTVEACAFTGNQAPGGDGGAIDNEAGALTVMGSTFGGNSAGDKGGAIDSEAELSVVNSTFHSNSAAGTGGAINGKITAPRGLTVADSTFADNSAPSGSGAIDDSGSGGPETVQNDIFAGNIEGANGFAVALANSNDGAVEDHNLFYGNYIVGTTTGSDLSLSGYGTDDVTGNPDLTGLGYFGGLTETMMPEPDSKAIGAGSDSDVPVGVDTDQRGFPIDTSAVDIGAVQTNYVLVINGGRTLPDAITTADKQDYTDIGFSGFTAATTIKLSSALDLTQGNTVIVGALPPDAVAISGDNKVQILNVSGTSTSLSLYGLTLENGDPGAISSEGPVNVTDTTFSGDSGVLAGAISSNVTLTVVNSTFVDNKATGTATTFGGGAIYNEGTLIVTGSTFKGNSASSSGGAIYASYLTTITDSTFVDNKATGTGTTGEGGGAIENGGLLTVTNSTFVDNKATGTGTNDGGGAIFNYKHGILVAADNIFANNKASQGGGIYRSGTISIVDEEYNLFYENYNGTDTEDDANFALNGTDVTGSDPELAPLDNYGGPTQTMLPLFGGAAICAGTATLPVVSVPSDNNIAVGAAMPTTDQRGFPRTTTYASKSHPTTCIDIGSVQSEADAQVVIDYINNTLYAGGTLTSGQANSLVKELDKAYEMASEGKMGGAINNLNDFITEVEGLYDNGNGVLTLSETNTLITEAEQPFPLPQL